MRFLMDLFNQYGYIVLFLALILELIALPLPGETLMTYCGYLTFEGKMNIIISIVSAGVGICIGITLSYFIGKKLGDNFFEKYGHYIHIDKSKLEKTSKWFERYGSKVLIVAYFIPGVRHITGYFSGVMNMSYIKFAINAYLGAFVWATTFIFLGNSLGVNWEKYHYLMKKYLFILGIIVVAAVIVIYIYKFLKLKKLKTSA